MEGQLLSLDIWDTVLRRRCYPDESKFGLAKYILLNHYNLLKTEYKKVLPYRLVRVRSKCEKIISSENMAKGWDDEYQINEVLSLWIDIIMISLPNSKKIKLVDEFIEVELKHELYISYLDPKICKKINQINYNKLIYISDFYMSKDHIDMLLHRYRDDIVFDDGVVSSDYNINKKSGKLFEKVKEEYNERARKHIHIGDNKISDVKSPRRKGIQANRYLPIKEHMSRIAHNINYILRCKVGHRGKGNCFGHFRKVNKQLKAIKSDDLYVNLGIKHSFYYIGFILAVIENAIIEQTDKVYYFTREGEFFKQIHDSIEKSNIFGIPIPKAEILEVSRIATFAPSIQEISIQGMMRLWAQYPNQSVNAFFTSLHINPEAYKSYFITYGLNDLDKSLKEIYLQEEIIKLFQDKEFIQQLKNEIEQKQNLLLTYLEQKGIHRKSKKVFIVDIGWRGSIQDNIALLFEDVEIVGFYMALFRPYNQNIPNSRKMGFVSSNKDGNYLWYLRHPYALEMYTNSRNGSVVGYEATNDGKVKAIRFNHSKEDIIYDKYVEKYQRGILSTVPIYSKMIRTYSFSSKEIMPYALKSLKKFMITPSKRLVKPYFELVYNSFYGTGRMETMSRKLNIKLIIKLIISKNPMKNFIEFVEDSHWPHGLFMNYHLFVVNWFYSRFAKRIYNDYSCIHPLSYSKEIKISPESYQINKDLHIYYEREELVSDFDCLYIRGSIIVPEELADEYEILIQVDVKNKKKYYTTNPLIKNEVHTANQACFEAKIPYGKNISENELFVVALSKTTLYIVKA